jgi:branched-chain amino acid transport system substrate-binding protein
MKKKTASFLCLLAVLLLATTGLFANGNSETKNSEIVIGCIQDTTGPTSSLGKMVQEGAQLAIDEINAAGGIDGKTIRMITYDTKANVNEAINAYTRAVTSDKVTAIIGPPIANIALAIAPISERYDVPFIDLAIDPKAQMNADGVAYKNMFCLQPSSDSQGAIMAKYSIEEKNFSTFGVMYNESNAYSVSLLKPFINVVEAEGKKIVKTVSYSSNDKDFKTLLAPILAANVDAIYCPNYTQEVILITQQARSLGYKGALLFNLDACPPFNTLLGQSADGIYFINNYDITNPTLIAMVDRMKKERNLDVTNKFFLGYDIAQVYAQAFRTVGTDSIAVRDYVENLKDFKGLTGQITMNPKTHFPIGLKMVMYTYDNITPVMLEGYSAD